MPMHGKAKASFSKSNHPAKKSGSKGLSGDVKKQGQHPKLSGKENPLDRTTAYSPKKGSPSQSEKSMASLNPLYHPGNKMAKE